MHLGVYNYGLDEGGRGGYMWRWGVGWGGVGGRWEERGFEMGGRGCG